MYKKPVLRSLILALFMGLIFGFGLLCCFAEPPQESLDEISITTYYPSPYGVYNEMRSNKMVIGEIDSTLTPAPSQGAITFKPIAQPTGSEGTLYYDQTSHKFKYRDNANWKNMGEENLFWFGNVGIHLKDGATSGVISGQCEGTGAQIIHRYSASAKVEQGIIKTRVIWAEFNCVNSTLLGTLCDSGLIDGMEASCFSSQQGSSVYARATASGVIICFLEGCGDAWGVIGTWR